MGVQSDDDKRAGEMVVAGAIWMALVRDAGMRCESETDATGIMSGDLFLWPPFMDSRYRISISLDPEPEPPATRKNNDDRRLPHR